MDRYKELIKLLRECSTGRQCQKCRREKDPLCMVNFMTEAADVIEELLKASEELSAQPRKGEWIDEGQYAEGHSEHAYYCSQCEEHYIGWIGEFNFCPNCGADMRGEL